MEQEDQAQELEETAADPAQDQGADEGAEEKDWKSLYEGAIKESRKWEKRSKASRAEIERLKAASPKQDSTLEERLAALEEENNNLKAAKARSALIDSVATATGVDRALVASLNGEDEEALTAQAEAIAAMAKPRVGAPAVPEAGGKPKPGKPSKRDILAIKNDKERIAAIRDNIDLFPK